MCKTKIGEKVKQEKTGNIGKMKKTRKTGETEEIKKMEEVKKKDKEDEIKSTKSIKITVRFKGHKILPWDIVDFEQNDFFKGNVSLAHSHKASSSFMLHSANLFAFSNTIRGKLSKFNENLKVADESSPFPMSFFPEFELIPFAETLTDNDNDPVYEKSDTNNLSDLSDLSENEFAEMKTFGTLTEYEDYYIISYDDYSEFLHEYYNFAKPVCILIFKNNPDIIMVSNNDFINEYLTFEKNRMTIDVYSNDIYYNNDDFEDGEAYFYDEQDINSDFFTINTHNISSEINETDGDLQLKYTVGMFGRNIGFTEYSLKYTVLECRACKING